MATAIRTPVHLWIVGVVSALWNCVGAVDYLMTETNQEAWLSGFSAEERAYFAAFPAWEVAFWALGVWGALLGSVLLLARSRFAVASFALSLVGIAVITVYQFVLTTPPASLSRPELIGINVAIWVIGIFLLVYSQRMRARGVLR